MAYLFKRIWTNFFIQDCAIIDTTKNFALERKPMKAEGILMHRSKNIIALRATQGTKTVFQVSFFIKNFN